MKMLNKLFAIIVLSILLSGQSCASTPTNLDSFVIPEGDTLVSCVHKYEESRQIHYLKSRASAYTSDEFEGIVVYIIVDIHNIEHSMNNLEAENYNCEEKPAN